MTSSSLSTKIETKAGKRGVFLMHSLRSYWWIAVICSVVYGFAGPVFTMLKLDSITSGSYVREISAGELLIILAPYFKIIPNNTIMMSAEQSLILTLAGKSFYLIGILLVNKLFYRNHNN